MERSTIMKRSTLGTTLLAGAGLALLLAAAPPHRAAAEAMTRVPAPAVDERAAPGATTARAVLAGGCFWGVQGVFQHVKGVTRAVSGYSGGAKADASYPIVSTGATGHAESVEITYDPREVSYGRLLQIYFSVVADPTTLDAQGPDEGPQYRSDIFATTPEQAAVAKAYIAQLQDAHVFPRPIVTRVTPFQAFYPAEAYHQDYLVRHPDNGYIAVNDKPKVDGLKALLPESYRAKPVATPAVGG